MRHLPREPLPPPQLLPIIAEVLQLQRDRASFFAERMKRLVERLKVIDGARAKVATAQTRAAEQASRQVAATSNPAGDEPRRTRSDGRRSKRTSSRASSPARDGAAATSRKIERTRSTDREQLSLMLRKLPMLHAVREPFSP